MKFSKLLSLVLACLGSTVGSVVAQDDWAGLLKHLPADSNSVFLINGKALKEAPPAVMEKWQTAYSASHTGSPLALPEGVTYVAMSTEFELQHMSPLSQVVVLQLETAVTAEAIAKARDGVVDQIDQQTLVWIRDACVFVDSEKQVTVVSPLNRQSAARWLRNAQAENSPSLSPYLSEVATAFPGSDPQIVMAVDLSNLFSQAVVRSAVERATFFEGGDFNELTRVLTSVRGVTIESEMVFESCAISIDFGEDIDALKPYARDFVNKALSVAGAKLGDPDSWKLDVFKKRILLTGKLTPSIMQRIFSLNTLGGVAGQGRLAAGETDAAANPQDNEQTGAGDDSAQSSTRPSAKDRLAQSKLKREIRANQRYFKKITDMLEDLGQGHSTNTLNDDALWISNYVRALESLPVQGIDPMLLKHGKYVSRSLESIVGTLHMTGSRIVEQQRGNFGMDDVEVTAVPTNRTNYGGHVRYRYAPMFSGYINPGSRTQEDFAIQDREIGQANATASDILGQVYQDHENVRQALSQKYGVEF